jgi:hypothetical protein
VLRGGGELLGEDRVHLLPAQLRHLHAIVETESKLKFVRKLINEGARTWPGGSEKEHSNWNAMWYDFDTFFFHKIR